MRAQRVKVELCDKRDTKHRATTFPFTGDKHSGRSYIKIGDVNGKDCYEKPARGGAKARYLFNNGIFWVLSERLEPNISASMVSAYKAPVEGAIDEHFPHGYENWLWKVDGSDEGWVEICMNIKFLPGSTAAYDDSISKVNSPRTMVPKSSPQPLLQQDHHSR
eukprot:SAG31_NODE_1944_length_6856_cov_3.850969_1_plen_163_part_00